MFYFTFITFNDFTLFTLFLHHFISLLIFALNCISYFVIYFNFYWFLLLLKHIKPVNKNQLMKKSFELINAFINHQTFKSNTLLTKTLRDLSILSQNFLQLCPLPPISSTPLSSCSNSKQARLLFWVLLTRMTSIRLRHIVRLSNLPKTNVNSILLIPSVTPSRPPLKV